MADGPHDRHGPRPRTLSPGRASHDLDRRVSALRRRAATGTERRRAAARMAGDGAAAVSRRAEDRRRTLPADPGAPFRAACPAGTAAGVSAYAVPEPSHDLARRRGVRRYRAGSRVVAARDERADDFPRLRRRPRPRAEQHYVAHHFAV